MAPVEQRIEAAQRGTRIGAFQIVLGAEEPLAAGLALAARDGAEAVEPAGDGGQKPLLAAHVGRDRAEQRRLLLVGAVGAPESLNGRVGLPSRFEQIVDAAALIAGGEIGMIAAPRPAGVRENKNALLAVHEGVRLGEVGRGRTVLDREDPGWGGSWPGRWRRTMRRPRPVTSATASVPK